MNSGIILGLLVIFMHQSDAMSRPSTMVFQNNQFTNVVVALHESIAEDKSLIDSLKDRMTKTSEALFKATRQRAYFKEVVILIPSTWSDDPSYGVPTSESIYQADVVITDNFRKRRSVHTRSYSGCGQQGVHVLLNKDFLSIPRASPYFNSPEKYFIHAFAQFRWGVFQEYAEEGESPFYISMTTGRPEAIRCVYNMRGLVQMANSTICYTNIDPHTGLYADGCLWRPYPFRQRIQASMMDFQFIQEIETFCDDNTTNTNTVHNYAAPNKHNRLCEHRSTWDVIQNSADFKGGVNGPISVSASDLTPTFRVVKATTRKRRAVLAIDGRKLKQGGFYHAFRHLGRLKREADRHSVPLSVSYIKNDVIIERIITSHDDVTVLCQELISDDVTVPSCKQMSGFEHDQEDTVVICDDLSLESHEGIIRHGETCGHTMLDKLRDSVLTDTFSGNGVTVLHRIDHPVVGGIIYKDEIHTDESLNSGLRFIFHYEQDIPNITVKSPTGRMCSHELDAILDDLKEIEFVCQSEPGPWTYLIKSRDNQTVSVIVMADTATSTGIDIRLILDQPDVNIPFFRVFVDVTQFHHPIVGLNVTASLETPSKDQHHLQLFDNGAGADMLRDDGVYSRYFTDVRKSGHYHVTASVIGRDGNVYRKEESFEESSDLMDPPLGFHDIQKQVTWTMINGTLQRHVGGRSIHHAATPQNGNDVIPPARITDLSVEKHVLYRNKFVVRFRAPGDDMDAGRVAFYDIYIGENMSSIPEFISYTKTPIYKGQGRITHQTYNANVFAMETEYISLDNDASSTSKSFVFGVVGVDESGNRGSVSNIVIVGNIA